MATDDYMKIGKLAATDESCGAIRREVWEILHPLVMDTDSEFHAYDGIKSAHEKWFHCSEGEDAEAQARLLGKLICTACKADVYRTPHEGGLEAYKLRLKFNDLARTNVRSDAFVDWDALDGEDFNNGYEWMPSIFEAVYATDSGSASEELCLTMIELAHRAEQENTPDIEEGIVEGEPTPEMREALAPYTPSGFKVAFIRFEHVGPSVAEEIQYLADSVDDIARFEMADRLRAIAARIENEDN